ncbi:MAG: DUF1499 domain-containing protein [Betaproteobacteria bacterium]
MSRFLRRARVSDLAWDLALLALILAIGDAIAGLLAGIGYRIDLWGYRDGIGALPYVFWLAVAICAGSVVAFVLGLIYRRPGAIACGFLAILIAGATAYVPWSLRQAAQRVPPIHDITTDTDNPPLFVRLAHARKPTDHPTAYDGPEVAAMQKKGYPDLGPILVKAPMAKVFDESKVILVSMGMNVVDAEPIQGRIEATDTSLLFGFEDDLVARIVQQADGTVRVDVRSKSRVGRSDLGINAHRIRVFIKSLQKRLSPAA